MARVLVEVLPTHLDLQRYVDFVSDPGAGATATFTGTTRDTFQGKHVVQLEYEAYEPMARKELQVTRVEEQAGMTWMPPDFELGILIARNLQQVRYAETHRFSRRS